VFDTRTQAIRDVTPNDFVHETSGYRLGKATDEAKREVMGFLWSLFEDAGIVDYVLDLLATALCGKRNLHSFVILQGSGGNGKSLFVRLLDNAFGSFFATLKSTAYQTISQSPESPTPDLMTIRGRRIVVAPEVPSDIRLREEVIKLFSGQDKITGRRLYQDPEQFTPQALFMMCCNDLPQFNNVTDGIRRRVRVVPFSFSFVERPTEPHHRRSDPGLAARVESEEWRDALMAILIERYGHVHIRAEIDTPQRVLLAAEQMLTESDPIAEFIFSHYDKRDPTRPL
jgi:putative DNA primase/helicase